MNLMKPLAFLSWFMTSSFQDIKQDGKIPVVSYETNPDEPTTIEVEFCMALLPKSMQLEWN